MATPTAFCRGAAANDLPRPLAPLSPSAPKRTTESMRQRLAELEQHHSERERFRQVHHAAWRQGCRFGLKRGLQLGLILGVCLGASLIVAALLLGRWTGA